MRKHREKQEAHDSRRGHLNGEALFHEDRDSARKVHVEVTLWRKGPGQQLHLQRSSLQQSLMVHTLPLDLITCLFIAGMQCISCSAYSHLSPSNGNISYTVLQLVGDAVIAV